jgi:protein required for attachment to host cells
MVTGNQKVSHTRGLQENLLQNNQNKIPCRRHSLSKSLSSSTHWDIKGAFDKLVLAADPDTLGEIRPLLHKEVLSKMLLSLDKTLTNSSVDHIERSIASGMK